MNDASKPFPHAGGCACCRLHKRCNVCGEPITAATRCTNGRCRGCCTHVCTPGGATSPGHGFGTIDAARARVARLAAGGARC